MCSIWQCDRAHQRLAIFFAEETRLNHARSRIRLSAKRKKCVPALQ